MGNGNGEHACPNSRCLQHWWRIEKKWKDLRKEKIAWLTQVSMLHLVRLITLLLCVRFSSIIWHIMRDYDIDVDLVVGWWWWWEDVKSFCGIFGKGKDETSGTSSMWLEILKILEFRWNIFGYSNLQLSRLCQER